ncbi:amidohydrolase family protein [Corynebacterium glucuronolyticum]|uniref:amidohydrolase family protein n=2 Tax=Corynebacterium TaxID=1716 RepID=UPI003B96AAF7
MTNRFAEVSTMERPPASTNSARRKVPYCKLSGLPAPEGRDVLQFIASVFPWSRLLYSSNWPVVLTYSGVRENLALLRETFEDSPLVFTENAVRVYNLERTSSC